MYNRVDPAERRGYMIEKIEYNGSLGSTYALLFDEPFDDYFSIMLEAATVKNKLQDNYKSNILKDKNTLFGYLLYDLQDKPCLIYFVQKDPAFSNSIARCFTKFYVAQSHQRSVITSTTNFWKNIYTKKEGHYSHELFIFKDRPDILERYNLNTVFFTRNEGRNERYLQRALAPAGFTKLDGLFLYRKVYQHFFVLGDPSFASKFKRK